MSYQVEVAQTALVHTAVIRGRVPANELPRFVPAACGEVWTYLRSAGLKGGRHIALYLEDGNVEVGAEVDAPFTSNGRVQCSQLPSGQVAATVHFGPYQRLREAHAAVREFLGARQQRGASVTWEIYGHWQESWGANPSEIRTDIFHLLQV